MSYVFSTVVLIGDTVKVCLQLAFGLRKFQAVLNVIVSPIYRVVLTKILWRKMRKMLKKFTINNASLLYILIMSA